MRVVMHGVRNKLLLGALAAAAGLVLLRQQRRGAAPGPREIAPGVWWLQTGRGITESNVYVVRSGSSWVVIDAAWPKRGRLIRRSAEVLFGPGARPAAMLLTHIHPDHSGSTLELARAWGLPVHVHPDELPFAPGGYDPAYAHPLDRWVVAPLLRLVPRRTLQAMQQRDSLAGTAVAFDPTAGMPGLPDWACVPTPGHTPGHTAFFRGSDRVLIVGDALMTVNLNSPWDFLLHKQQLSGPPYITTWNCRMAKKSVADLAELRPRVIAGGHGVPMAGAETAAALRAFAARFAGPDAGARGG
jgi:glyoxylase-like metal-dependent hydrolase (beta-lactamase superfamily II)